MDLGGRSGRVRGEVRGVARAEDDGGVPGAEGAEDREGPADSVRGAGDGRLGPEDCGGGPGAEPQKTMEVPQNQYVESVVDASVQKIVEVPQASTAQKYQEIPNMEVVDEIGVGGPTRRRFSDW